MCGYAATDPITGVQAISRTPVVGSYESCIPGRSHEARLKRPGVEMQLARLVWKGSCDLGCSGPSGSASCSLIPVFPERWDTAAPVTDGAILAVVTRYVKPSQTLKIRAGFPGRSLFVLVQQQESEAPPPSHKPSHISHIRDATCSCG